MTRRKVLDILKSYFVLTVACFIFAVCWEGFMIPNGMSAGGLMGLCTVIQYATSGVIQASYSYIAINGCLIILSIVLFGIGFGFRTIYCIALTTVFLELVGRMDFLKAVEGNFFYVPEALLIPLIAGVLEAVAVGLILRNGGSTGGTDIIALVVNKYWPISLSKVFLATDFIIICLLLFLPDKSFGDMVYGFEMMIAFSLVIDSVIGGKKSSFQLLVLSEKYDEIADHIIHKIERGVTVLKAQGWFTKEDRNVLLILVSKNELPAVTKAIKDIDSRAFMSVSQTHNVYGEGFEEIKAGLKRKKKDA